jgi:hypothetical protein
VAGSTRSTSEARGNPPFTPCYPAQRSVQAIYMIPCGSRSSKYGLQSRRAAVPSLSYDAYLHVHQQLQQLQCHQPYSRCPCRRASSRPGDFPFDERTRRGLREAAEVLQEAQELAQQQTLAELMGSCRCCCCFAVALPLLQTSWLQHLTMMQLMCVEGGGKGVFCVLFDSSRKQPLSL